MFRNVGLLRKMLKVRVARRSHQEPHPPGWPRTGTEGLQRGQRVAQGAGGSGEPLPPWFREHRT